jgi:hypothetical protein
VCGFRGASAPKATFDYTLLTAEKQINEQPKNERRYRAGTVDLCACPEIAKQQAVEELAVPMGLKTSDCEADKP